MWRNVLGVVAGCLAWMFAFYAVGFGMAALWPAYGERGRLWFQEGQFTFTTAMAVCNLLIWFVAAIVAGWVTMKISRRAGAVWVLAGLIGGYVALFHLVLEWPRFPWWYNLGVVLPAVPAVLLGARLVRPVVGATR